MTVAALVCTGACAQLEDVYVDEVSVDETSPALGGGPVPLCFWDLNGWDTKLQGTVNDDSDSAVATDPSGCAIYTAGWTFSGPVGFGDIHVTKYSTFGTISWTAGFGTSSFDGATSIAVDSNHNVYVAGCTGGTLPTATPASAGAADAFLAKHDSLGAQLWVRQIGSAGDDCAHGVAVDASDQIFITGMTHGALPSGGTPYFGGADAFIAKYSSGGTLLFSKLIGTPNDDEANAIAIGNGGKIFVTGYTRDDLPFFTEPMNPGGNWQGGTDIFTGKYDPVAGGLIWIDQRGTSQDERANGIAINAFNEVFVGGYTRGGLDGNVNAGTDDLVTISYRSSGVWRWTDQVGSSSAERAQAVTVDTSGRPFVAGYTDGPLDGQATIGTRDAVLIKYTRGGARTWTRLLGDSFSTTSASGVAGGFSSMEFVVGATSGSPNGTSNQGSNDAFIVRYDSAGSIF